MIRWDLYETASSAVHALTICRDGMENSCLYVDSDGYIITDFGDFGDYDMGMTTFDQNVKLSYLATEAYYLNHYDENIEDSYMWRDVCDAICEYTGARGVKVRHKTEPSLNHQVVPDYDFKFCNAYNRDSVNNFIFNKYVGINMSHD